MSTPAFLGLWLAAVWCAGFAPLWALVPDVVADREATLAAWKKHAGEVAALGWRCAFAVQDGMTAADVPSDADVVFVGGTTDWKWRTLAMWCERFKRVHVGRVNTPDRLHLCAGLGAESVDGTGWMRLGSGDSSRWKALESFLAGDSVIPWFTPPDSNAHPPVCSECGSQAICHECCAECGAEMAL